MCVGMCLCVMFAYIFMYIHMHACVIRNPCVVPVSLQKVLITVLQS